MIRIVYLGMLINKPGTTTFWIDPKKNPFAFKEGNKVKWSEFILNDEHCIITSEGKTLSVIMNPGTKKELLVFQTSIDFDRSKKHHVGVTWATESVCLYYDGQLQQEINPEELP